MSLSHLFQSLDLFGVNFQFKMNGALLTKSAGGGVLSIIFVSIMVLFLSFNLIELFLKAKPKIISYQTSPKEGLFTPYNDSNLLIAYDLQDNSGNYLLNSKNKYSHYFLLNSYHIYNDDINNRTITNMGFVPCMQNLNRWFLERNKLRLNNLLCVNFENKLIGGNYYGVAKNSLVTFELFFDYSRFLAENNNDHDLMNTLFPVKITVFYSIIGIDLMNFADPLNSDIGYAYFFLNLNQTEYLFTQISKIKIYTDSNYLTTNYSTFHDVDTINQNFIALLYSFPSQYYPLVNIRTFMNPTLTIYYRSYMKLQDLLNNISSISNILILFFSQIAHIINEHKLKFDFIEDNYLIRYNNNNKAYFDLKENIPKLYRRVEGSTSSGASQEKQKDLEEDKDPGSGIKIKPCKRESYTVNNLLDVSNQRGTSLFEKRKQLKKNSTYIQRPERKSLKYENIHHKVSFTKKKSRSVEENNLNYYDHKQINKEIKIKNYFMYLLEEAFCRRMLPEHDKKLQLYNYVLSHFNKTTDISNIIKSLDHIEILKYFVLNPYQSNLLNNSKIIVDLNYKDFKESFMYNKKDLENYYLYNQDEDMKFIQTMMYFKRKISRNKLNEVDLQVMNKIKFKEN